MKKQLITVIAAVFLTLGLAGCDKGPAEKAGEDIDNAATNIGNKIEDACEEAKEGVDAKDQNC